MDQELNDEVYSSIAFGVGVAMAMLLVVIICYCLLEHWLRCGRPVRTEVNPENIEPPIELQLPTYEEATRVVTTAVASAIGVTSTSGGASVSGVASAVTTRRRRRRRSRRSETVEAKTQVDGSTGESYTGESSNDNDSTITRVIGDDSGVSLNLGEKSDGNPSGSQEVNKSNAADDSGIRSGDDDTVDRVDNISIGSTYDTASSCSAGGGSFRAPSPWLEF